MKKYREGKFEKDDVLLDIYEIVELVTLEAVEIYKNKWRRTFCIMGQQVNKSSKVKSPSESDWTIY